jgi:DDE superfamily endonuclease
MSDPDSGALQGLRIRSTAPEMSFESPVDIVNGTVQQQRSSPNASPAIAIRSFSPSCATIDANVPPQLDIHLIVDNYATHKHHKVRAWLARHPRWHIHITPTFTFWLNQLERCLVHITQCAIRRGS